MKIKSFYILFLCFFMTIAVKGQNADGIVKVVTGYLKTSNTQEIAKNFASTVELIILSEDNVYSKIQAELILKDFFSKHKPVSAKLIHLLDSNPNYRFAVIALKSIKGDFRISFSLKDTGGKFLITDMRIELEKG